MAAKSVLNSPRVFLSLPSDSSTLDFIRRFGSLDVYVVYVSRLAGCYHRWDANNSAWKISSSEKLCIARLLDREIKKGANDYFNDPRRSALPFGFQQRFDFTFASGVILETRVQGSENNNYGGRRRGRICRLLRVIVDFWRRKSKLSPLSPSHSRGY